jgi:hypothetical protein
VISHCASKIYRPASLAYGSGLYDLLLPRLPWLRDDGLFGALIQMSKSRFTLIGFSFGVGVDLVFLFLPLITGEPRSETMTTAMLTIQKALLPPSATFPVTTTRITTPQGNRIAAIHTRDLAEPVSFNGPAPKRSERLW